MDCNHARLLLTFARDHADLDQSEADGLEEHLSQCAECLALSASERHVDAALAKAMNAVPTPPGLKERILAKLPRSRTSWRRWIATTAAAAAVVLLAITISWHVWPPKAEPDFEQVSLVVTTHEPQTPEVVEAWFEENRLPMAFPQRLNARRLSSYSIGEFQGRRVPRLEFVDRSDSSNVAHVFVLSERQFNVKAEVPSALKMMGARSLDSFKEGPYLYVVIYTGSLEPFF